MPDRAQRTGRQSALLSVNVRADSNSPTNPDRFVVCLSTTTATAEVRAKRVPKERREKPLTQRF
jgi:hypothetical protein